MRNDTFTMKAARATHAVLRIGAGLFFMLHGGQKLFGWFGGPGGRGGTVPLASLYGVAGVLELVGGALLVLGLLTRPMAFLLAGEMAVAYFMSHFPRGFWPIQNQGEPAALYSLIFLYFAAHGAGAFSVDALLHRDRHPSPAAEPTRVPGSEPVPIDHYAGAERRRQHDRRERERRAG